MFKCRFRFSELRSAKLHKKAEGAEKQVGLHGTENEGTYIMHKTMNLFAFSAINSKHFKANNGHKNERG